MVVVGAVVEVVCVSLCDTSVGFPVTGPLGVRVSSGGDVIAELGIKGTVESESRFIAVLPGLGKGI